MSKRATHTGECQVCGARQMLPGGVLAKHGYAVLWNMFSGVCRGSGHAPFEQSIELVKLSIARAESRRDALLVNASKNEAGEGPLMFNRRFRKGGPKGIGYNMWVEIASLTWREVEGRRYIDRIVFADGDYANATTYSMHNEVLLRTAYTSHLRHEAMNEHRYIQWQHGRIENWAPRELQLRQEA